MSWFLLIKMNSPDLVRNERGIALFIVLWVLVLLSVIAGEFSHAMRTAVNITRNFKEETEAYYIARAGVNAALKKLIRQETRPRRNVSIETSDKSPGDEDWRVNTTIPPVPFASGKFQIRIENESGKVNINAAGVPLLRVMLDRFDLMDAEKDIIVDSIIDWRDTDSFHRVNGAEDDYYEGLAEPYEARDAPFLSVSELLLVRGVTPAIFYGGLNEMVTVHAGESGGSGGSLIFGGGGASRRQGQNRININAASPQLLDALPGIGPEQIQAIQNYRAEKDFEAVSDLQAVVGPDRYAAISPYIMLENTSFFTIRSTGMISESPVQSAVNVLAEIDPQLERKFRIVQWIEE